jgi:hypothetical protein
MINEIIVFIIFLILMVLIMYRNVKVIWLYVYFIKTMKQFQGNKYINKIINKKKEKNKEMSDDDGVAYQ